MLITNNHVKGNRTYKIEFSYVTEEDFKRQAPYTFINSPHQYYPQYISYKENREKLKSLGVKMGLDKLSHKELLDRI